MARITSFEASINSNNKKGFIKIYNADGEYKVFSNLDGGAFCAIMEMLKTRQAEYDNGTISIPNPINIPPLP